MAHYTAALTVTITRLSNRLDFQVAPYDRPLTRCGTTRRVYARTVALAGEPTRLWMSGSGRPETSANEQRSIMSQRNRMLTDDPNRPYPDAGHSKTLVTAAPPSLFARHPNSRSATFHLSWCNLSHNTKSCPHSSWVYIVTCSGRHIFRQSREIATTIFPRETVTGRPRTAIGRCWCFVEEIMVTVFQPLVRVSCHIK